MLDNKIIHGRSLSFILAGPNDKLTVVEPARQVLLSIVTNICTWDKRVFDFYKIRTVHFLCCWWGIHEGLLERGYVSDLGLTDLEACYFRAVIDYL